MARESAGGAAQSRLVRGVRRAVRNDASAYAYSILITVSVGASLGAAAGIAQVLSGLWAWSLVPLTATVVYVALTGAQLAVARIYEERHPPDQSE